MPVLHLTINIDLTKKCLLILVLFKKGSLSLIFKIYNTLATIYNVLENQNFKWTL